jgi:serine/threonine-protein kinase
MRDFYSACFYLLAAAIVSSPGATAAPAAVPADMVEVPAGEFVYGDDQGEPDERPVRRLTLPAFAIDRTETTVGDYQRCVSAGRCKAPRQASTGAEDKNLPVVEVSFVDASAYCAFVGKRLPSEPEWEKAARGPQGRRYPWGDTFDCARGNFGNFAGDGRCAEEGAKGHPVPVGSFPEGASPYGALDLAGNVWEWVEGRYDFAPLFRPELRVLRGGGCCSIFGLPRASDRLALPATYRDGDIGFRCARSLPSPAKAH